ncbi:hypothetical protein BESB_004210 [Besnoitia besnoiti]|uniref:TTF-type domain-containing protein n=1 Tax=Besnoitia besnoiti TaxID=94643 RepID=A0A2A9MQ51_BESBE|nr:hypothetical protein BESB_004210 [Besnoitia besnoiti]PFH38080.1 hypothetical protein BESB_004210 [Besnoitia besnoiti]
MTRADVLSAGAEPLPTRPVCASAVGESAALEEDAALAATAAGKSAQTRHVPGLESVLSEVLLHPDALKAVQAAQKEDSEDACAFGSPALPAYHARLVAAAGLNGRSHPVSRGLPSATDDLRVARRLAKAEDHESAPQKAKGAGAEGRCERGGIGGKRYRSPPVSSNSSPTFLRGDYLPAQAAPEAEALSRSAKRAKSQRWAWDDDPAFRIQDPATWSKESIAKYIDDLVLHGPPQCDFTHFVPPLTNKRRFSLRELCVGIEERRQDRKWMLYSTSADAVFCFPCLLFSPRVSKFVSEGFCLWRNQGKRYREHETSSEHRAAVMKLDIRRKAITDSCIVLSLLQKVGRAGLLPLDDGTPVPA